MDWLGFHPVIEQWFTDKYATPTAPQINGWPPIAAGKHTLIAAPTGSGKTLTAFLACIDRLFQQAVHGALDEQMKIVYVSPLRALSNDMHRNLTEPLAEIREEAKIQGIDVPEISVGLRTGDTPASRRAALVKKPPHIFVTTPESLYLMLTAERGRSALRFVDTVIVDEIHALVRDKRGSHLSLTLERLEAHVGSPIQRIGLSATQKPIEQIARFLVGDRSISMSKMPLETSGCTEMNIEHAITNRTISKFTEGMDRASEFDDRENTQQIPCEIIDVGHQRQLDLGIEIPFSEINAVCTHEQWAEVNLRIVEMINQHRSTLLFVNTRRMAERLTHQLTELLGEDKVGSHHGSLSADIRLKTERELKEGRLKAVVATASLELGIDVGYIDQVIQLGSPRSIAAFLQRIGRSGHALGLIPKGRIFALTRDELLEAMALIRAVKKGRLDQTRPPVAPLDILAQQIVAETASQDWDIDALFECFRKAWPYRQLKRSDYDQTIEFLSEGLRHPNGRSRAFLHVDRVQRRIRARKGARISATSNGGAIPEIASYRVVTEPEGTVVGSLDEEFAVESNRGDVFLLGNTSWRILHIRGNDVTVADAQGAPPTIPFWQGEAPGRTLELSEEISILRKEIEDRANESSDIISAWLQKETECSDIAAEQTITYVLAEKAAIGLVPTQDRVVFERFFDETGGMQLVVHAPYGGDINRAWAFAMRKRFCVSFDFELQATADDNGFILSLGPQHSFPIEQLFPMLRRHNARELLEQAVLFAPSFENRWRWNVTRALLVDRMRNGKRVPPALQRFRAQDLLTAVFPKLTGCQEEHSGAHEIPDHPLTNQTMEDCLNEPMDIDGLNHVLDKIDSEEITLIARDTREPSPFCYQLLNSNPYTFLDGGEVQERRARAITNRRSLTVESVQDLARLDPAAIQQVREEARPMVRDADELHDVLLGRIVLFEADVDPNWQTLLDELMQQRRVTHFLISKDVRGWVSAERLPAASVMFPQAKQQPVTDVPQDVKQEWTTIDARIALVRGVIETCGPTTADRLSSQLGITASQAFSCLEALEGEGIVLRGRFENVDASKFRQPCAESHAPEETNTSHDPVEKGAVQWCHRRLLSRIHRLTMQGLRREIEPVDIPTYFRFLFRHHGLDVQGKRSKSNGVFEVVSMLQGIDISSASWESEILARRVSDYRPEWFDELCFNGEICWGRLYPPPRDPDADRRMANLTRNAPISLWLRDDLSWLMFLAPEAGGLCATAERIREILAQRGAVFASDLMRETGLSSNQLQDVLGELITRGFVTSDGFGGLRHLIAAKSSNGQHVPHRKTGLRRSRNTPKTVGRWSLWRPRAALDDPEELSRFRRCVEQWAWQLLRRWGVVFKDLLTREQGAPSWFELLRVYRRLEARGEIRGGRFVRDVGGEQFATSETVAMLRSIRDEKKSENIVTICASDPVNLVGIVTPHKRIPSISKNRLAFLNGMPLGAVQGEKLIALTRFADEIAPKLAIALRDANSKQPGMRKQVI